MNSATPSVPEPVVSIIIPVFNQFDLTAKCLTELSTVTKGAPYEIIVVDNASTDGTPARLKSLRRPLGLIRNELNAGFARASNQGAAAARGKYLLFLNNDTIPLEGWMDEMLKELKSHPEVAVVGSKLLYGSGSVQHAGVIFERETRSPAHPYRQLAPDDPRVNHRREMQTVTAACMLVRAPWFKDCGGFDEAYINGYEDLDFCLKVRQRGGLVVYQPRSVVFHLESQTPGRYKYDNDNRAIFFKRWHDAVLADEDAFYHEDGYRAHRTKEGLHFSLQLIRFTSDEERARWSVVAQAQRLAAAHKREQLIAFLSSQQNWPADAGARKWAGVLCHRLGLADTGQGHLRAALEFGFDPEISLRLSLAGANGNVTAAPTENWTDALLKGHQFLSIQDFAQARTHFEKALIQGAPPRLVLPSLQRAVAQAGAQDESTRLTHAIAQLPWGNCPVPSVKTQTESTAAAAAPDLVSIIIPTFNKLELTKKCLESLRAHAQDAPCEVIVVDNASTDGTVDFLKAEEQAGRLRAIFNPENAGFARACNQGARAARAASLLFLNNDTQVTTGWLDALSAALGRDQTGVAGAKLLYADGRIQHAGIGFIGDVPDHPHRHVTADAPEVNQFRELDMVTGACLMIRRELFMKLDGFDEAYRNGVEDIDLCLRVRTAGWKVVYEPKAVVYHLEGQSAGRFDHVAANLRIFFDRWGKSFDAQKNFIVPKAVKHIAPARSLLLAVEAPMTEKPVAVAWEGTFLDFGSLSNVNRQLAGCLAAQPAMKLSLVGDATLAGPASACNELVALARSLKPVAGNEAQVTVRHQWPVNWSRPRQGALVVIQPWEFGALPSQWVQASADVDEFWVPSNHVRQVYIDSGVSPDKVVVIPNGVDPAQYHPEARPLEIPTRKKFRFLFVGGTIKRKGPDVLLRAYLEAFTADDDVCLVIKDFGGQSFYQGQTFEKAIAAAKRCVNAPEILYLNSELPPADMPRLYAACHCLVHPYRGEGFGLPVLEAMACGLPVVVTKGGATDDFVTPAAGWLINSTIKNIGRAVGTFPLVADGWWLEPDVPDLVNKLRHILAHPEEARARGRCGAVVARKNYSWERVAEKAKARVQLVASVVRPQAEAVKQTEKIEPPAAALLGKLDAARQAFGQKQYRAAWDLAAVAIQERPYHPGAWLLMAECAREAGAQTQSRLCVERARKLAPRWKPAAQFAKNPAGPARNAPGDWPTVSAATGAPRLSVCLIVKNEERFLAQCLESIRDIAHQIVVVDTGSTDRTIEIAKEFKAEIHTFAWNDDFSAARNEALKHATGDWVLSLDADEELLPEHKRTILEEIKAADAMGYRLPIIDKGSEEEGCNYVPRLFRNAPGLCFAGRIHEQIFKAMEECAREFGLQNRLGRSVLLHHGYKPEVVASRGKTARNLKLLQLAVAESPGDANLVMNLGLEFIRSGQFDAGLEHYRQALRLMAAMPPAHIVPELRETLLTQLTTHLLGAKRFREIVELWRQPFPQSGGLTASQHFMLGVAHLELKEPAPAAEQMRQCLAKRGKPALSTVNKDILQAGPRHCLAVALATMDKKSEADQAFRQALAEDPKSRVVRFDFARFHFQQGRPVEALKLANELAAEDGNDVRTWHLGGQIALTQPEFLDFTRNWTSEAVKHAPNDTLILLQRAEALLLSQETEQALPLWTRAHSPKSARHLAALTLCEVLAGECTREIPEDVEKAVSQEFLKWYRHLLRFKAVKVASQINDKLDEFRAVLPSAVEVLGAAMKRADEAMAV